MNLDNSPINNKNVKNTVDNDMVTDMTELNDSTEIETSQNIPVPENINPLPNGRWHKAENIYTLIKEKKYVHTEVPSGNKSNCYMLVDNKRNVERVKQNKKSKFYDDCGVWMSQKGRTVKSYYYLVEGNLVCCELKKDQYCVRKRKNGKTSWVPLDPQPEPENIVVFTKYYATLKADPNFQNHVTFVYRAATIVCQTLLYMST